MAQVFHRSTNSISRFTILCAPVFLLCAGGAFGLIMRSSYITDAKVVLDQPVPFSHKHHVGEIGIDCRFCHGSVETSAFAGIPPTRDCMICHSQLWSASRMLEPVRSSFRTGAPIRWTRVDDLPDYVYFDHSIHVHQGVGCTTCHGPVDQMPLTWREASLQMEWCLQCHRHPERYLRPRDRVFDSDWRPPEDQVAQGARLVTEYHVRVHQLTNCSVCHR